MKILIVEDHPLIQEAWRMALGRWQPGAELTLVGSRREALERLQAGASWTLALIDLQLPDGSGLELLEPWRQVCGDAPVVVVSANDVPSEVLRSLQAGARGFLSKAMGIEGMLQSLQAVLEGSVALPPLPPRQTVLPEAAAIPTWLSPAPPPALTAMESWTPRWSALLGPECQRPQSALTPRQREVLELLLQGKPNKLIARQLNLSVETVKDHVAALLRALGVRTRLQAALVANTQPMPGTTRNGTSHAGRMG